MSQQNPLTPAAIPTPPTPTTPAPAAGARMPPPVVPHDTRPHVTQAVAYDRLLVKLKVEYPETHPAVVAAVAAIEHASGWNARRGATVVFEWLEAHDKAVAAVKAVMETFPEKHAAAPVDRRLEEVLEAKSEVVTASRFAEASEKARMTPPPAPRPSLLFFGHPTYKEALQFVFRGRHPDRTAGLPIHHLLGNANVEGLARRGLMIDVPRADPPKQMLETAHMEDELVALVEEGFLEVNESGGCSFLRLSKREAEVMGVYHALPAPAAASVPAEAPDAKVGPMLEPAQIEPASP